MANALTAIAVLALWWALQVWLLPRLGVPTWVVPRPLGKRADKEWSGHRRRRRESL